jgi:subtilisin family serine protease
VRLAIIGVLAAAVTVVQPIAMQAVPPSRQVTTIDGHPAIAGEVLVKPRRLPLPPQWNLLRQLIDADRDVAVGGAGVRRLHSRRFNTSSLLDILRAHPEIVYAEPNYVVRLDAAPNDVWFGHLWGLLNTGQTVGSAGTAGADIDATTAWDVSTGSRDHAVAVVDTGIDYWHPDLAANIWSAPAPFSVTIGEQTITCAAGTHGFNAIARTCDPYDDHGHGTHVAGTIGAVGGNNSGVVGVNWTASIVAAKFLDADGLGTIADAIDAIEFVIQAASATGTNVRVLSNSWGNGASSQALLDQITSAHGHDMLFVASAGNEARDNDVTPRYPAGYNTLNMIAVASTNNRDMLAGDSNYGANSVHLAAPGVNILSTFPEGSFQYLSGTSMAVPHVSGAAVLVLSHCALDTTALRNNLLASVDANPLLAGRVATGGRLNVNTAIRACGADSGNGPPLAADDTAATAEGTAVTIPVLTNDSDPDGDSLTVTALEVPQHGQATAHADGTITYMPAANYTGADTFTYRITDGRGLESNAATVSITVTAAGDPPPPSALAVDATVSADGAGTISTPPFSTAEPGELIVAFVGSDGPPWAEQQITVSGAELPWTLVGRANTSLGTSEIWQARAETAISNAVVFSVQAFGGYHQSMTVVAFKGAAGVGATAAAGDLTGAPSVSLVPTRDGSFIYAVGNDWDGAIARVVGPAQTMVHEWVDTEVGDTFWVQALAATATAGTAVTLDDTDPTSHQWNFAAVEILPIGIEQP